jgi:hypothetical protein
MSTGTIEAEREEGWQVGPSYANKENVAVPPPLTCLTSAFTYI